MSDPIGVVLAGGRGRRMGAVKAAVPLGGRPLIAYSLAALRAALADVVVLAKPDTRLPGLPGVPVWSEPASPQHPLVGIRAALEQASGQAVLVCALDLPFVSPGLVRRIAQTDAPAVVAAHGDSIQPLLGLYRPEVAPRLGPVDDSVALREVVAGLAPALVEVEDMVELFNVNTPEELKAAEAILASRT